MASPESCSKCTGVLDTDGSPKWCKSCRAKYQREYNELKVEKSEKAGWHKGVRAMRDCLAEQFGQLSGGSFDGAEVEALIMQAPGPSCD